MASSLRRALMAAAMAASALFPPVLATASEAGRDDVAIATADLLGSRSYKVRTEAALVLGRRREARAVPYLLRALADVNPVVRAMAAEALGEIGDETSRPGLEVAVSDRSPLVRRHAVAALKALSRNAAAAVIDVKAMGDRTNRASPQLREQMRRAVAAELRGFKRHAPGGLAVDGAIKALGMSTQGGMVEVRCAVQLILSTGHGNAMVMMTSGEATVQRWRGQFRPAMRAGMEREALEQAVHGAAEELRDHFAANGL